MSGGFERDDREKSLARSKKPLLAKCHVCGSDIKRPDVSGYVEDANARPMSSG